jgi:hypothetical protein
LHAGCDIRRNNDLQRLSGLHRVSTNIVVRGERVR